jgi:hypothetical protein
MNNWQGSHNKSMSMNYWLNATNGKTEVLGEKPIPEVTCSPQILLQPRPPW